MHEQGLLKNARKVVPFLLKEGDKEGAKVWTLPVDKGCYSLKNKEQVVKMIYFFLCESVKFLRVYF